MSGNAAADSGLRDDLQRCSRYLALLADELEAAGQDDESRLREVREEREKLAGEGESGCRTFADDPGEVSIEEFLRRGTAELRERTERQKSRRELWNRISEGALRSARVLSLGPIRVGGAYRASSAPRANALDMKF